MKGLADEFLDQKAFDEDTLSAPPFFESDGLIAREEHPQPSNLIANSSDFESKPSNGNNFSRSFHACPPIFHASYLGPCHSVIAYEACVRLCQHALDKGCREKARMFLENEYSLLRSTFNLQHVLLQPEEEVLLKCFSDGGSQGGRPTQKKSVGKMKVQVHEVKTVLDPPNAYSFSRQSLAYKQAGTKSIEQDLGLIKTNVSSLRSISSANEVVQETYFCFLRLKSSDGDNTIPLQPGSSKTQIFFPQDHEDDLILDIHDSKGTLFGRVLVQVATILDDPNQKLQWWPIYRVPEHKPVGKIQLYIAYASLSAHKCGRVTEMDAYDVVLEVAMKVQNFCQRNLALEDSWVWLLKEFASYYGVSDAYTKLRYLSYIMDVATPTADCLSLVYDLLSPCMMKERNFKLSNLEKKILGNIKEQIEETLADVFKNYKSLDENSPSGMIDGFRPATEVAPLVLTHALKLYKLTHHDIQSVEAKSKLYRYFQDAVKKRSILHLTDTLNYIAGNGEGILMDPVSVSTAYLQMKSLCLTLRNEIYRDIEIHNCDILPSFVDLPNLSSALYSADLSRILRDFLVLCPSTAPSPHVIELLIATVDFQKDLDSWNVNPVKRVFDAKELFHLYIMFWIEVERLYLIKTCKVDKAKSEAMTQHSTTMFVDGVYARIKEALNNFQVIMRQWPNYTFTLEKVVADIEKAVIEALEKQYADVVRPLKETMTHNKFVQKLTKTTPPYIAPPELGILLNSMKRMLDDFHPEIELQLRSWGSSCIPDDGNVAAGERLSEVTALIRSKFESNLRKVAVKLVKNTRLQKDTKLKKILKDSKQTVRMQPLVEQLTSTMDHLHMIFERPVFISACREYWDKMGHDVLGFLEKWKKNRVWYKGSTDAVTIYLQTLDETFASRMQHLLENTFEEKDLEPPASMVAVRSFILGN